MELLIVILAVGASAVYLARKFWRSVVNPKQTGCADGCGGCCGSSEGGHSLVTDDKTCTQDCQGTAQGGGSATDNTLKQ